MASVKLTIVLLVILAATSIVGTIIPQQERMSEYIRFYGEGTASSLQKFGLTDMYHAPWFIFLLGMLVLNLLVCSIKRFPSTWKVFKSKPKMTLGDFSKRTFFQQKTIKNLPADWEEQAKREMTRALGKPEVARFGDDVLFFSESGRWSRFGVYVVHLSLLIIFIGAIVGALFGFKGMINIPQGGTVDYIFLRGKHEPMKLDFSMRCDSFTVRFYPSGAPEEFRADLTFIKSGREEMSSMVRVNDPISYGGITFYMSTYGRTLSDTITFELTEKGNEKKHSLSGSPQGDFQLPGGGSFAVVDYRSDLMNFGPAVKVHLHGVKSDRDSFWVFKKQPPFIKRPDIPYEFQLIHVEEAYYPGLQANRDPGVWLVYTGFCLMVVGLVMSFFCSHRMLWVQKRKRNGTWQIIMAGSANKNRPGYKRLFGIWWNRLSEQIK